MMLVRNVLLLGRMRVSCYGMLGRAGESFRSASAHAFTPPGYIAQLYVDRSGELAMVRRDPKKALEGDLRADYQKIQNVLLEEIRNRSDSLHPSFRKYITYLNQR